MGFTKTFIGNPKEIAALHSFSHRSSASKNHFWSSNTSIASLLILSKLRSIYSASSSAVNFFLPGIEDSALTGNWIITSCFPVGTSSGTLIVNYRFSGISTVCGKIMRQTYHGKEEISTGCWYRKRFHLCVNLWKSVLIRGFLTIALKVTKEMVRCRRSGLSLLSPEKFPCRVDKIAVHLNYGESMPLFICGHNRQKSGIADKIQQVCRHRRIKS